MQAHTADRLSVSLSRDVHAAAPADQLEPNCQERAAAEHLVLADMEAFSDFVSCHGKRFVSSERITRHPAMVESRLRSADTAEVLHLILNGEPADCLLARDEVRRRYLLDNAEGVRLLAIGWALERAV